MHTWRALSYSFCLLIIGVFLWVSHPSALSFCEGFLVSPVPYLGLFLPRFLAIVDILKVSLGNLTTYNLTFGFFLRWTYACATNVEWLSVIINMGLLLDARVVWLWVV